ncbi:MAG: DUF5667 domain-containing protein [Patescibacteria group bacterium]
MFKKQKMTNNDLIKQLKQLKSLEGVGRPDQKWASINKETLLSQISPNQKNQASKGKLFYFLQYGKDVLKFNVFKPALSAFLVVLVFFGYSATVMVANASLPGDMLYPIKTTGEQVQLALTFSDEKKINLQIDFVSRRADEMQQLARSDQSPHDKAQKISQTAKKISQDVTAVKNQLYRMAADTNSSANSAIQVAKNVDDKTNKIEKDIVDVHNLLSSDVKKEVATDVKDAIVKTEDAGTNALATIVQKADTNTGAEIVSDQEITNRVNERIKTSETAIATTVNDISKSISTSTITIIVSSSSTSASESSTSATSTIKDIMEKPKQAQEAINQAKDLLGKKDFTSALDKIQESKVILGDVIAKTATIDNNTTILNNTSSTVATGTIPVKTDNK